MNGKLNANTIPKTATIFLWCFFEEENGEDLCSPNEIFNLHQYTVKLSLNKGYVF